MKRALVLLLSLLAVRNLAAQLPASTNTGRHPDALLIGDSPKADGTVPEKEAPWRVIGEWHVINPDWTDNVTIRDDGTHTTSRGSTGKWTLTAEGGTPMIIFRWDNFGTESALMITPDHFRGKNRKGRPIEMWRIDASQIPAGGEPRPEKSAPKLEASDLGPWGQPVNPDGDCKFLTGGARGELEIDVPGENGPHDLAAEMKVTNAPRVLQTVGGNFVLQVRVDGRFEPGDESTLPGRTGYNGAGLVLIADPNNVVTLARAALQRSDEAPSNYANFEMRVDGELERIGLTGDHALPASGPVFLRLERHGRKILGAVSEDGKDWHELTPKELPASWSDELQVGVVAISTSQHTFKPQFSNLQLSQ